MDEDDFNDDSFTSPPKREGSRRAATKVNYTFIYKILRKNQRGILNCFHFFHAESKLCCIERRQR